MKPVTYYVDTPLTQALATEHGAFLQAASDRQLKHLLLAHAAAIVSTDDDCPESLYLCDAIVDYLQHRVATSHRTTHPQTQLWASS